MYFITIPKILQNASSLFPEIFGFWQSFCGKHVLENVFARHDTSYQKRTMVNFIEGSMHANFF